MYNLILALLGIACVGMTLFALFLRRKVLESELRLSEISNLLSSLRQENQVMEDKLQKALTENQTLTETRNSLNELLVDAGKKLAEFELAKSPHSGEGLFEKAVQKLAGFGVPGLVFLAMVATSGFYGAAAITSTLATLGGPGGMMVGVGVLIALGLLSEALTQFGYEKIGLGTVKALINKGESIDAIREKIKSYPSMVVKQALKDKMLALIDDFERSKFPFEPSKDS